MPYREPSDPNKKELEDLPRKDRLFYVSICYKHNGISTFKKDWVRAEDGFKALMKVIDTNSVKQNQVWAQEVISFWDFIQKDRETE